MQCYSSPAEDAAYAQDAADRATRAACEMGKIIRAKGLFNQLMPETKKWLETHEAFDAERISKELAKAKKKALVRSALAKLTDLEREALGISLKKLF